MKLVFVTQTLDPDHAVLAQTVDLVHALAERWDEVAVVTRTDRWSAAPANTTVQTFDASTRAGRTLAFERALWRSIGDADAVFVHMVPEFALLAAPQARIRRVPLLLWYTHWHASRALHAATRVSDAVLSVDASSFPVRSDKLRPIGHAIDTAAFAPDGPAPHRGQARFLAVGRTARWKGLATLLDAFASVDGSLEIRGPSLTEDEQLHRAELEARVASDERLRSRVEILPPVARAEIPALYGAADVIVSPNEPRSGSTLDKAVFEAAACARPVVSTNPDFAGLLGDLPLPLLAPARDPSALAATLASVGGASPGEREAVGAELRRRVVQHHSLGHWADAVTDVIREVRSSRGG